MENYAFSPWKEGRTQEEKQYLLQAEELEIKDGVEAIGNYTFYGCRNLKSLKFTDSLKQIGGGSFTGCSALRKLYVKMSKNMPSCIKDVVAETFHEVYVTIEFRETGEFAKLIFPEYYEEGVENTPARILETHFHGCGYRYRQCFTDKKVDYHQYDSLFKVAKVYEKQDILIPMALGRLMHPYELAEEYEADYRQYITQKIEEAGIYYLKREDWHEGLAYLIQKGVSKSEEAEQLITLASKAEHTEAVSFLMEEKKKRFGRVKKTFEF